MPTTFEQKLSGGVAVITGAGSGIGKGLAHRAAQLGMTVVLADVSTARVEAVAAAIRESGGIAEAKTVDVSKPAELDRLAEEVYSKHGSVRLLVNNAGIETLGLSWEIPAARWETTLNVNVHGVVHGVRAFAPRMLAEGKEAWIANLSSVGGFSMMPTQSAYIMTKHAVQSFTECLALEMQLKKAPIHVCSVIPGCLKTGIFDEDAGAGEHAGAGGYRKAMFEMMKNIGMDLDEGCRIIMEKIAEGKFWVDTQPEMTAEILGARIKYLQDQSTPQLVESVRSLYDP